jgi:hypothetical protein
MLLNDYPTKRKRKTGMIDLQSSRPPILDTIIIMPQQQHWLGLCTAATPGSYSFYEESQWIDDSCLPIYFLHGCSAMGGSSKEN